MLKMLDQYGCAHVSFLSCGETQSLKKKKKKCDWVEKLSSCL